MLQFLRELGKILEDGILAVVTLGVHLTVGCCVLALPALVHPYVHWLYGEAPPMLVGTLSLVDVVHIFDYAVGLGIMGVGGARAIFKFWRG